MLTHLGLVVYSSSPGGQCDDEAIAVTNENALYKAQAKFLVDRQDLDLWAKVPCFTSTKVQLLTQDLDFWAKVLAY